MKLIANHSIVVSTGRFQNIGFTDDGRGITRGVNREIKKGEMFVFDDEEGASRLIEAGAARLPSDDDEVVALRFGGVGTTIL